MKKYAIIYIALISLLIACGKEEDKENTKDNTIIDQALPEVMYDDIAGTEGLSYQVPESKPGILVDLQGYKSDEDKIILFVSDKELTGCNILDASSGEVVYTTDLIETTSDQGYHYYADISSLTSPGTYYALTDIVGRSYDFKISDDIYSSMRSQAVADIISHQNTNDRDVIKESQALSLMLMAYELNPEYFEDQDNNEVADILDAARNSANFLLTMQDSIGAIAVSGHCDNPDQENPVWTRGEDSNDATLVYAAALANFARIYRQYDGDLADKCLYSSETAYKYVTLSQVEDYSKEYCYMADACLYKTTGIEDYGTRCNEYKEANPDSSNFIGDFAYLTTSKTADIAVCTSIINSYAKKAENISNSTSKDNYFISQNISSNKDIHVKILEDMLVMSYMNYLITNKEYRTVIQNHMHYLCGQNEDSKDYLDDKVLEGDDYLYYRAEELFILSSIDAKYKVPEQN